MGRPANSPIRNYSQVAVYDGPAQLGTVARIDARFIAVDAEGHLVGEFRTQRDAVRAFDRRRS
jgi:hypothetical protein